MLELDSPRWGELRHAYRRADDIPQFLTELEAYPGAKGTMEDARAEPWFSLWSALCHQGDVYTASYAALPHLVRIGLTATERPPLDFFWLPTAVEIARRKPRSPQIPEGLASAYFAGLHNLHDLAHVCAAWEWDMVFSQAVAAALLVSKGHGPLAEAILALTPDVVKTLVDEDDEEEDSS